MQPYNLNKENFWNGMMERFPDQMKEFCAWIDKYKNKVDWDSLFDSRSDVVSTKFHHIPLAMQAGIWMQYVSDMFKEKNLPGIWQFEVDKMDLAREIEIFFLYLKQTALAEELGEGGVVFHGPWRKRKEPGSEGRGGLYAPVPDKYDAPPIDKNFVDEFGQWQDNQKKMQEFFAKTSKNEHDCGVDKSQRSGSSNIEL